jgi:hypothetical protein
MLELCQVIKCLIQLDFLQMTVTRETKFFFTIKYKKIYFVRISTQSYRNILQL